MKANATSNQAVLTGELHNSHSRIAFVGDLHGDWKSLMYLAKEFPELTAVVQVGDFGFYPTLLKQWKRLPFPVYALDGNHEYFPILDLDAAAPVWMADGLYHVPRGIVFDIAGLRIGAIGGASSVDIVTQIAAQQRGGPQTWWPQEVVLQTQVDRLLAQEFDVLVTHTPVLSVTNVVLRPLDKDYWDLPKNWIDLSAMRLEPLYALDKPTFCGHIHQNAVIDNVRVLGIGEFYIL